MKFNFKKDNIGDYIPLFLFFVVITASYYLAEDYDPEAGYQNKGVKVKRFVQELIDLFGSDLPVWLQIFLFLIVSLFFGKLLKSIFKRLISWFKKK